ARQVALLRDLVQLGLGLRRRCASALALSNCRALLAKGGARLLRHLRDRLLARCGLLGLFDVCLGRLGLFGRSHGSSLTCAARAKTWLPKRAEALAAALGSQEDWVEARRCDPAASSGYSHGSTTKSSSVGLSRCPRSEPPR